MRIQLSDHFTYKRLLRFTLSPVCMMIFTSVYGVVDGLFVSNFVGKTPFAAVNFIMPLIMILCAFGFMFGAGGSALIAKTLGEGKKEKANSLFSLFVYVSVVVGIVLAVAVWFLLPLLARAMGAEGQLHADSVTYGRILVAAMPLYMLQVEFQTLFITAEKPHLGLVVTLAAGVGNIVLDALFVAVFRWGLEGAAYATALSQAIGGLVPLGYFFAKNNSLLRLGKTSYDGRSLFKGLANGSSELMTNVAMSLVGMLYNVQLLKYAGENGVAAYGVLMYVNFIFIAVFIGYSIGTAPVIGYHYGAQNGAELKGIVKRSFILVVLASLVMFALGEGLAAPLSKLFVGYDAELYELTRRGFFFFSFSFLLAGISIFASSLFTALNNGMVSAAISFLRTLVFQIAAILILPLIWGTDGIWVSIVVAEVAATAVSTVFVFAMRKRYGY